MKILDFIKNIWSNREKVREVSNIIIRFIDAVDGHQDWVRKDLNRK